MEDEIKVQSQKINEIQEKIETLNYIMTRFEAKIEKIKLKDNLIKKQCEDFQTYYSKLVGLKRISIPLFGKISCGKSTLLNYFLCLHDIFETNYNISTKFVCIIRHNGKINSPKIYNVEVSERGEYIKDGKKFKLWNFEKDDEIKGDIKEIISKRNHELQTLEYRDSHWKKYFMLLEANIPFFHGEYEYLSEYFEFMDIPGLNEFNSQIYNSNDLYKKEDKGKKLEKNEHFYFKELIPFFVYNIGFSLYVFDAEKRQSSGTFSIINDIMENFYDNNPVRQKNSIFILNKTDIVKDVASEIIDLKRGLSINLKCHIENDASFIGLSSLLLYLKRFKYRSFFDYLFCIIEENKNRNENIEDFLINIMSKDFNTEIEENFDLETEEKIEKEEEEKLKIFNKKIINKGLKGGLSEVNYIYYKKYFDTLSKNKNSELGKSHKQFEDLIYKNCQNYISDFIKNFSYSKLYGDLLDNLGIIKEEFNILFIKHKKNNYNQIEDPIAFVRQFEDIIIALNEFEPDNLYIAQITNEFNNILDYMHKEKKIRIPLLGEYSSGKSSLLNSLIGNDLNIIPVDTKICTNIALVVRYTKKDSDIALYQTILEPTTEDYYRFSKNNNPLGKGAKVIKEILNLLNILFSSFEIPKYHQSKLINYISSITEEEEKIEKVSEITQMLNGTIPLNNYQDNKLKLMLEEIKKKLHKKSKNEDKTFYERAFFLLTVPIEAYDFLGLEDDIKEKIELIDFPGLDSANNYFKSNVLGPLLKFSDGFMFVNKGNTIKENEKVTMLLDIINKIQLRKFEFSFKSCLFVLNRCDETEINIDECKKEYESLLQINKREEIWNDIIANSNILKNSDSINVTKFSNKLYADFQKDCKRINNFVEFINYHNEKNKYTGKKYLEYLKKNIYKKEITEISEEKYKNFKYIVEDNSYKNHFKDLINDKDNLLIVKDIIKMYEFIKMSIYENKFYLAANGPDFFKKFENQLSSSKLFYEESLRTLSIKYLLSLYQNFEFMKIKILQDEIDIKFTKEEFDETKNRLKEEYENEKKKINNDINSTMIKLKKEYDDFLNNIKNGNIKDYEVELEKVKEKIGELSISLEKKINDEIPKYRENLLSKLNFIVDKLKQIEVNKGKLSSKGLFDSIYNIENKTIEYYYKGLVGLSVIEYGYLGISALTAVSTQGIAIIGKTVGSFCCLSGIASLGIGFVLVIALDYAVNYAIHGGFELYKKLVEKDKYYNLIKDAKAELEKSLLKYEESINEILLKITKEIEMAVKNFFDIQNVKLDGIKAHMEDWLIFEAQLKSLLT